MRLVLARQRDSVPAGLGPPQVHAYQLPDDDAPVSVLRAVCGHVLERGQAEQVNMFEGAPCGACLLYAVGRADGVEDKPFEVEAIDENGKYAKALRGEPVVHIVGPEAVRGTLEGHPVVQVLCCLMARGPVSTVPEGWAVCSECAGIPT